MRRRQLLTATSLAVLGVAGCSSSDSNPEPTTTDTATQTPTATETPTPPSFEIVEISTPDGVPVGDPLPVEITVRNTGESSGVWTAPFEYARTVGPDPEPEEWADVYAEVSVPGGDTVTEEIEFDAFQRPAVLYLRFDDERIETIHSPLSKAPIIEAVNLVTGWENFGDAVENKTQTASAGGAITIATRFWDWLENQTSHTRTQVRVYETDSNTRVGIDSYTSDSLTDTSGWRKWETALPFDTSGWGAGEYRAEALIRDEQNDEVSEPGTVTFELT